MNKKGHMITYYVVSSAIIGTTYFFKELNSQEIIRTGVTIGTMYIGNFLPDMDAEHSYIGSKFPIVHKCYKIVQDITRHVKILNDILKHRGVLLHSVWTIIILKFLCLWLYNKFQYNIINIVFNGLCYGILLHHIMDMFTGYGLRYFYPLKIKIFRKG